MVSSVSQVESGSNLTTQTELNNFLSTFDFTDMRNLPGVQSVVYDDTTGSEGVVVFSEDYQEAYRLEATWVLETETTVAGSAETLIIDINGTSSIDPSAVPSVAGDNLLTDPALSRIDVVTLSESEIKQVIRVEAPGTTDNTAYQLMMELTEGPAVPPKVLATQFVNVPATQGGVTQNTIDTAIKATDFSAFERLSEVKTVAYDQTTGEISFDLYGDEDKVYALNTSFQLMQTTLISAPLETLQVSIDGTTSDTVASLGLTSLPTQPVDLINAQGTANSVASVQTIPSDVLRAKEDYFTLTYQGVPDTGNVLKVGLEEKKYVNIFDTIDSVIKQLRDIPNNGVFHEGLNYGRLIQEFDSARNHFTQNRAEIGIRLRQLDLVEFFQEDIMLINFHDLKSFTGFRLQRGGDRAYAARVGVKCFGIDVHPDHRDRFV